MLVSEAEHSNCLHGICTASTKSCHTDEDLVGKCFFCMSGYKLSLAVSVRMASAKHVSGTGRILVLLLVFRSVSIGFGRRAYSLLCSECPHFRRYQPYHTTSTSRHRCSILHISPSKSSISCTTAQSPYNANIR